MNSASPDPASTGGGGGSPGDCDWFLKLLQTPAPAEGGGGQR